MPGTADGVVNHQPFCKRTVIMAAVRIDCEYLRADLHQKHFVISDMAKQLAFGEIGRQHALRQIGSAWFPFLAHDGFSLSAYPQSSTMERTTFQLDGLGRKKEAKANQGKPSILRLAWLAPDIATSIVHGRQPLQLTARALMRLTPRLPTEWAEQRELLGFR